jgi:hypothetical protein
MHVLEELHQQSTQFNCVALLFDVSAYNVGRIVISEMLEGLQLLNFSHVDTSGPRESLVFLPQRGDNENPDGNYDARMALMPKPGQSNDDYSPIDCVLSFYQENDKDRTGLTRSQFIELVLSLCCPHAQENCYTMDLLSHVFEGDPREDSAEQKLMRQQILFACQFRDRLRIVRQDELGAIHDISWNVVFDTLLHWLFLPLYGVYVLWRSIHRSTLR